MEIQYPGVYVEEYDAGTTPIEGVSTSTGAFVTPSLASDFRGLVQRVQPDWTDGNAPDPGVTLLEVVAWLADALLHRFAEVPEPGRRAAQRAIAALSTLAGSCGPESESLARPNFFDGRLLDDATLRAEQDYHREMRRRHNRMLHGWGIVEGLGVRVEAPGDAPGGRVRVEPGHALDGCGEEIVLGRGAVIALPQAPEQLFVSLRHHEVPCGAVPTPSGEPAFSRIEEACVVALVDAVSAPAIALARLRRAEGRWAVDPTFAPQRVRGEGTRNASAGT